MNIFINKKNLLWDFDGVLIDSENIRVQGFKEVLSSFPEDQIVSLLEYHKLNGGLSRYVKFRHFFEEIRGESITEKALKQYSGRFSELMRSRLTERQMLIKDSLNFIQKNHNVFNMHIVSGSDCSELRYLCKRLEIARYFISIQGSPTPKSSLVEGVISNYRYNKSETLLIGDSINDFEAAKSNNIAFFGYNNILLQDFGDNYIFSFATL